MHSSIASPQFSERCQEELDRSAFSSKTPLLFCHLLSAPYSNSKSCASNVRAYNNFLTTGCVKANLVSCDPGRFSFNPRMTVHARIYRFLGFRVPPCILCPSFLSVYFHNIACSEQRNVCAAQMVATNALLLDQQTALLHICDLYV